MPVVNQGQQIARCQEEPIPGFEWIITDRCNYRCSYCAQERRLDPLRGDLGDCSDHIIESVYRLLPELPGCWLIKLIGGEAFIHPRFFEMCQEIINAGHELYLTTNFSCSLEKLRRLIGMAGPKLRTLTASLHLSQVKDLDAFTAKAAEFQKLKAPETDFCVTSVVVEEDFELLKSMQQAFEEKGIAFEFQLCRGAGGYIEYPLEIQERIAPNLLANLEKIKGKNFFGTICQTGRLFFKIRPDGEVMRCYTFQPWYYLGNIGTGTFHRFDAPRPCMARVCKCTVPVNRNMIRFGEKTSGLRIVISFLGGHWPNLAWIRSRLVQKFRHRLTGSI